MGLCGCSAKQDSWDEMKHRDNPINAEQQLYWRARLSSAPENQHCLAGECGDWDGTYSSSDDPKVDLRRRCDQRNYYVWLDAFCLYLGREEADALSTLEGAGACVPCIGRILYTFLRSEFILMPQEGTEERVHSPNFPTTFRKPLSRLGIAIKGALLNYVAWKTICAIISHCGHPYYAQLALLLNHGASVPCQVKGGSIPFYSFSLIETEFKQDLLRKRATRGGANPIRALLLVTKDMSLEQLRSLTVWLRSKHDDR